MNRGREWIGDSDANTWPEDRDRVLGDSYEGPDEPPPPKPLISGHVPCPCMAGGHAEPDPDCDMCEGDGLLPLCACGALLKDKDARTVKQCAECYALRVLGPDTTVHDTLPAPPPDDCEVA